MNSAKLRKPPLTNYKLTQINYPVMEVWQVKPGHRFSGELAWVSTQSPGELAASQVWSKPTSFPGSFISPPQRERGKKDPRMKDPGNEVGSKQFCTNDSFHMLAGRFRRTSYHKLLAPFLAVIILYSLFT